MQTLNEKLPVKKVKENTAKAKGANAVTNIVSFYKSNESKNSTTYECAKGTAVAAVALKGDIVKF